jgi:hypothetical protein
MRRLCTREPARSRRLGTSLPQAIHRDIPALPTTHGPELQFPDGRMPAHRVLHSSPDYVGDHSHDALDPDENVRERSGAHPYAVARQRYAHVRVRRAASDLGSRDCDLLLTYPSSEHEAAHSGAMRIGLRRAARMV